MTDDTETTLPIDPITEQELFDLADQVFGDDTGDQIQDIWYKGKRVIRTLFQVAAGFIVSAPTVIQIIAAIGADPSTHLGMTLAAIGAATTTIAGVLARIMAVPAINQWLVNIGLGSVPKDPAKHAA